MKILFRCGVIGLILLASFLPIGKSFVSAQSAPQGQGPLPQSITGNPTQNRSTTATNCDDRVSRPDLNDCLNQVNSSGRTAAPAGVVKVDDTLFLEYGPKTIDLNNGQFDIHPSDINEFEEFGARFIRTMSGVVVLISILVFMIGSGFWIFSAGNESLVERGKDMMIYSIIGLLFVLGAYIVVKVIQVILYSLGT